jgi:polysaccharide biosynthesis transport protein
MNPRQPAPPAPVISRDEIYHILFRHKWLIAIIAVAAVSTTLLVRASWTVPYESEAMLIIKYVHDSKPPETIGPNNGGYGSGDIHGESVVNSEIKILASYDLASNVVETLGAAKILAKAGGGTNRVEAANLIRSGFVPEADKSDVIGLKFTHPDAEMVQPILGQIIVEYLKKHREVHQPEFVNFLETRKDEVGERITSIDKELQDLKKQANIDSTIDQSEKTSSDLHAKILSEKLEAEADYAGEQATIEQLQKLVPPAAGVAASTNIAAPVNNVAPIPQDKVNDYQKICEQLNTQQSKLQDLLRIYTTNNFRVQTEQAQVASVATQKKQMEKDYPGLIALKPAEAKATPTPAGPAPADPRVALNEEITKANALAAKIKTLVNQLALVQTNTALMTSVEGRVYQLQNEKQIKSGEFAFYSTRLEEERVNETVGLGNSNISPVEQPTPPKRDFKKLNKMLAGILFGGLALALALPFVIELYLDRSLKRPVDVQARLGLPFFISIPQMNGNSKIRGLKKVKRLALLPGKKKAASELAAAEPVAAESVAPEPQSAPPANGHVALWERHDGLQPFYETLRDRVMTYFEMNNLTHKPKLVAVTSCGKGAGVTSTAAGLASSLSETGDGSVLLVNMNARDGEAHHFYKGRVDCGLDDVFEKGARENALVKGRLYVAKELPEDDRLPRVLPKRFSHLLPKMKASDFDYIIFDMPPVSQISITPRLARFMDIVLLVIESGKTNREVAARAAAALSECKTNLGIVLNKNRSYGPRRHHHDI